ncbi:hypothetical protein AB205_0035860 [Aquarana catesbeiana]|uniref:Uncharacterized protein n=1 Tax=Aquarana catesbeiana TaxID=8400 RepID=A0A2G9SF08_AQUCT|nr:hypothetical protein AB205_0035860 [Aquarana catesbeiana]
MEETGHKQNNSGSHLSQFFVFCPRAFPPSANTGQPDKYCPLLIKEGGLPLLVDVVNMPTTRQETKDMASLKIVRFENRGRISMGCTSYLITLQCPLVAKNYFAMSFQKTDPLKVMKLKRK